MTKKTKIITSSVLVIVFVLIIGAVIMLNNQNKQDFLNAYDLNGMSVEEMVLEIDSIVDEEEGFYAAITGEKFIVGDEEHEFTYSVPKDKFYLSFAPYINSTHPCANHNLVTCRGELQNETMHVLIENNETGEVVIDDNYTSMANGFIGIWLPNDIDATITVTYNGKTASSDITTSESSYTCLTTLQLS